LLTVANNSCFRSVKLAEVEILGILARYLAARNSEIVLDNSEESFEEGRMALSCREFVEMNVVWRLTGGTGGAEMRHDEWRNVDF